MPPKSTTSAPKSKSSAPPSRKSARVAGEAAPEVPKDDAPNSKKRAAEEAPKSKSKKSKPESKPAPAAAGAPKSKAPTSKAAAKKEEEKKAEAPASAKPDTSKGVLKVGDVLPKLTLEDQEGVEVDIASLAKEKGVVMFLYPKADTPGCTTQACGFRDAHDEITELGYDIYGLSKDKAPAQKKWATKKELKYKLLSDPESKLIKRLGAFVQPNNTKRSHFIFEKGTGKLLEAKIGVSPKDDPDNCVKFIKSL